MHERTLEQMKEGVKIIRNPDISLPKSDGEYILTISNNGKNISIKPLEKAVKPASKLFEQKSVEPMSINKCKNCGKCPKVFLIHGKRPYQIECYCGRIAKQVDENEDCINKWNEMNL